MARVALRERWPLFALLGSLVLLTLATVDAQRRNAQPEERARMHEGLTQLLGNSDLALSSSSRWLRHPSQMEPAAAAADAPAILDTDPAGALIPPDPRVLGQHTRSPRGVRGPRGRGR